MGDLNRLIEAVEAGTAKVTDFAAAFPQEGFLLAMNAYMGDLNSAKRMHEVLLPGWEWLRWPQGDFEVKHEQSRQYFGGDNTDPARAWLLATLKAYRSTQRCHDRLQNPRAEGDATRHLKSARKVVRCGYG